MGTTDPKKDALNAAIDKLANSKQGFPAAMQEAETGGMPGGPPGGLKKKLIGVKKLTGVGKLFSPLSISSTRCHICVDVSDGEEMVFNSPDINVDLDDKDAADKICAALTLQTSNVCALICQRLAQRDAAREREQQKEDQGKADTPHEKDHPLSEDMRV